MASKRSGIDYLLRILDENGRFEYIRDLHAPSNRSDRYNLLRHAGTLFCILEERRDAPVTHAKQFLLACAQPMPFIGPEVMAITDGVEAKLGATALTLVALLAGHIQSSEHRVASQLANYLVSQQDRDGHFRSIRSLTGNDREFESLYYPGEAILALTRAFAVLGAKEYLAAAVQGARHLADKYASMPASDLPADHWLMIALNQLCQTAPEDSFRKTAILLADEIVETATWNEDRTEACWGSDKRLCPAATRAEGLAAAIEICAGAGEKSKGKYFLNCLESAVAFCLRHQVNDSFALNDSAAQASAGGFVHSSEKHIIRIDYVQHAVSAINGLLRARTLVDELS